MDKEQTKEYTEQRLLPVKEVAKMFNRTPSALYRAISKEENGLKAYFVRTKGTKGDKTTILLDPEEVRQYYIAIALRGLTNPTKKRANKNVTCRYIRNINQCYGIIYYSSYCHNLFGVSTVYERMATGCPFYP